MISSVYQNRCLCHLLKVINTHMFSHVKLYSSDTSGNSYDDPTLLHLSVPNISNMDDDSVDMNTYTNMDKKYDTNKDTNMENESDECLYNTGVDGLFYKYIDNRHAIYSPAKGTQMLKDLFYHSWYRLHAIIKREYFSDPHPGLRKAVVEFTKPYIMCKDSTVIALAVMKLLIKYVYPIGFKYGKFTIGYTMITPRGDPLSFSIGKAIELIDESGNAVPNMDVYLKIEKNVILKAEEYDKNLLQSVYIRVYMLDRLEISDKELPSSDEIASIIWN